MSDSALEAQGMVFRRRSGNSPDSFVAIPEIKSFSGPSGSASVIDVTDLSSAAKEKRMGLADEGQIQFTINYIPEDAVHAGLRSDRASRTLRDFQMQYTDDGDTLWEFSGFVTGFSVSGAVDGVVEAQVTIEISGAIEEN